MKTTSLKRSRGRSSLGRNKIALTVLAVLVLIGLSWLFPNTLFALLYGISTPFRAIQNFVGGTTAGISSFFENKSALEQENSDLKHDLAGANIQLLSLQALENQNENLQKMVAAKNSSTGKSSETVFATVTEKPPFSPYDILIINVGSDQGVSVSNPVFSDNGTPIGTIASTYPSESKVILFSSSGVSIPVVLGQKKFEATAEGAGGGDLVTKVPVGDAPAKGDSVYIPAFSPKTLAVVTDVSAGPTDAFANVSFALPENIFELSYVTVDTSTHFSVGYEDNEATTTSR